MQEEINRRDICHIVVISMLFFTELAFYTTETLNIYILMLAIVSLYCGVIILKTKLNMLNQMVNARFVLWVTSFFLYITIDSTIRVYGDFNTLRLIANWGSLLCLWILLNHGDDDKVLLRFSYAAELAAVAGCSYICMTDINALYELQRVGASLSGNVNSVGMALGLFSFGAVYLFLKTNDKIHGILYCIILFFMLITGSKKVLITLGITAGIIFKTKGSRFLKWVIFPIILYLSIFLIFTNQYLYNIIGHRILDFLATLGLYTGDASGSFSTSARVNMIEVAWDLFLKSPIVGLGYGGVAKYSIYGFYSHNNYTEVLACYGILGFIYYYYIYVKEIFLIKKLNLNKETTVILFGFLINALLLETAAVTYFTAGSIPYVIHAVMDVIFLKKIKSAKKLREDAVV